MNKIDEVLELLKQRERESEKPKNVILWVLAIVGAVAAVAGIAYAVYRFVTPDYLEDFEDDFDDDFDDYFEDEGFKISPMPQANCSSVSVFKADRFIYTSFG